MLDKIGINSFLRNIEMLNRSNIYYDSENKNFVSIADGLMIDDLDLQQEQLLKREINRYKGYTIEDLKKIDEFPEERKKLYTFLNTTLYNNFYDISKILISDNYSKAVITPEIDNEKKLSIKLKTDNDIKFTANVKSFRRIIEKMNRKNITNFGELTDIVRGRIECKDFEQVLKIVDLLKNHLPQQNKEILKIDNMILSPRDDYMGVVHLIIRDKETGLIFELQVSSQHMLNFFNRKVKIDYGTKEIVSDRNIFIDDDQFSTDYHDLLYKSLNKLKNDHKYKFLWPKFRQIEDAYLQIQREIFEVEKQGIWEHKRKEIEENLKSLDSLVNETFSEIKKQEIIKSIEE